MAVPSRWYLMASPALTDALSACQAMQEAHAPGAALSVVFSLDAAQVVVKVPGADDAWQQAQAWASGATVYGEADHAKLRALMNGPAWRPADA